MFDYRFTRDSNEYMAKLREEAISERLARSASSSLAGRAATLFRTWANHLESRAASRPAYSNDGWPTDQERYESRVRNRPTPYAGNGL